MRVTDSQQRKWALVQWAEAEPQAHAAQVYALYATLVGIRAQGPQGISLGMPPSLRTTRFSEYWEDNERPYLRLATPAGDATLLYDWCVESVNIVRRDGDAFWTRLRRYIVFVEHEWLGRIVCFSPRLRLTMQQRLDAVPAQERGLLGVAFDAARMMMTMRR